jgi:hypothetical protein
MNSRAVGISCGPIIQEGISFVSASMAVNVHTSWRFADRQSCVALKSEDEGTLAPGPETHKGCWLCNYYKRMGNGTERRPARDRRQFLRAVEA